MGGDIDVLFATISCTMTQEVDLGSKTFFVSEGGLQYTVQCHCMKVHVGMKWYTNINTE